MNAGSNNRDAARVRVALAIFAHPDDAEILCGGTLAVLSEAGWDVHVATVANGDCGSRSLPREEIAEVRREEARRAAAIIGATYHCLDVRDQRITYCAELVEKAVNLLRRLGPRVVITHPRKDYIVDHEQTHLLVRAASFSYPMPNVVDAPVLAQSSVPFLYYSDPIEGCNPYDGTRVTPTTYVDITDTIEKKMRMLECHESQIQWLEEHHGASHYGDQVKQLCRVRGGEIGVDFAEAFVQHRGHGYPTEDFLANVKA